MRYSYAALGMIIVGMLGVIVLIVFQDVTINNESDYYSIKEAMEASMVESIDKSYYAKTGELKIVEQKFVANFTRRFINNTVGSSLGYTLEFYDIMESPPKATVVIKNSTDLLVMSEENADIVNNLTAILEATVDRNTYGSYYCKGTMKTGTYDALVYYSYLQRTGLNGESSTFYRLNVGRIKENIGLGDIQIKNLRVAEITGVELIDGKKENVNSSKFYSYYGSSNINISNSVSNTESTKIGSEKNNCYTAGVQVSIEDAYGGKYYDEPIIKVTIMTNDTSISGCSDSTVNTLVEFKVVWKYDYCER